MRFGNRVVRRDQLTVLRHREQSSHALALTSSAVGVVVVPCFCAMPTLPAAPCSTGNAWREYPATLLGTRTCRILLNPPSQARPRTSARRAQRLHRLRQVSATRHRSPIRGPAGGRRGHLCTVWLAPPGNERLLNDNPFRNPQTQAGFVLCVHISTSSSCGQS